MAQVYPCISICIYICVCVSGMTTTLVAPTPSHLLGLKEIVWLVPNHQDLCKIKWNHQKTVLCLPKELVNHLVKQMVPPLNALTQMASPPPFFLQHPWTWATYVRKMRLHQVTPRRCTIEWKTGHWQNSHWSLFKIRLLLNTPFYHLSMLPQIFGWRSVWASGLRRICGTFQVEVRF